MRNNEYGLILCFLTNSIPQSICFFITGIFSLTGLFCVTGYFLVLLSVRREISFVFHKGERVCSSLLVCHRHYAFFLPPFRNYQCDSYNKSGRQIFHQHLKQLLVRTFVEIKSSEILKGRDLLCMMIGTRDWMLRYSFIQ